MEQTSFHPGEHLQEELTALAMTPAELALLLGVPASRVTAVLGCEAPMDAEMALRLAHFFGTSAQFWLNLQSLYELEIAEREHGAEIAALPALQAA